MTITNHMLAGALITKFLPLPIALPLAFISHFVLDALPHFGIPDYNRNVKRYRKYLFAFLTADCLIALLISLWILISGHALWLLGSLVAFSPDLLWIYRFIVQEKFGTLPPKKYNNSAFTRFHIVIQQYQRIWGLTVEIVFAVVMIIAVAY